MSTSFWGGPGSSEKVWPRARGGSALQWAGACQEGRASAGGRPEGVWPGQGEGKGEAEGLAVPGRVAVDRRPQVPAADSRWG